MASSISLVVMQSHLPESIRYVGVDDFDLDLFESQFALPHGISYNSYLILDQRTALLDTVDWRQGDRWLVALKQTLGARRLDYLILHHLEPDHSGCVAALSVHYPDLEIVVSEKALRMLPALFPMVDFGDRIRVVKENEQLVLGRSSLRFLMAPMVHWPEVMVSVLQPERVLFSADAFGTFGARSHIQPWIDEARRYYFNICGKYGVQVQALLRKTASLPIDIICPLHGPELTAPLDRYWELYACWSRYEAESAGVMLAHASIYGATTAAVQFLAERLRALAIEPITVVDLCHDTLSSALAEAFRMRTTVLASSSYDGTLFPPMQDFLYRLTTKGFRERRVALIENGLWAPAARRVMREQLQKMACIELLEPLITLRGRFTAMDRERLNALAEVVASGCI